MNIVQPIRDKNKLEEMKEELKKRGTRDYLMFYTGINTGLRVSDLLKLNRDDIRDENNNMKSHITIIEKKNKKNKKEAVFSKTRIEATKRESKVISSYSIF